MKQNCLLFFCLFTLLFACQPEDPEIRLSAPEAALEAVVKKIDSALVCDWMHSQDTLGKIRFMPVINGNPVFIETIEQVNSGIRDTTWIPVWGRQEAVRNQYKWVDISCIAAFGGETLTLTVKLRLYDDGLAVRYVFDGAARGVEDTVKYRDQTSFTFAEEPVLWATNRERHNIGPIGINEVSFLERKQLRTPVVAQLDQHLLAIHEAEIVDMSYFELAAADNQKALELVMLPSKMTFPFQTSWRTFFYGEQPGDLITSHLLENLNPPCALEDVSWIKPGKSLWDWRVWGYEAPDGFVYGLNTESHKRFIDFAAAHHIEYLLIDADWYGPEFSDTSDPSTAREGVNIEECMHYAQEKGVGIILYLNDIGAKKFGLERVLKQFSEWGASGVKYGFMTGIGQEKVKHTRNVIRLCAKYNLLVNFHDGPVPPNGDYRTYPNVVTREYCHAQADAKRSYWPETAVTSVFVNMIAGPLDMTNGWYAFDGAESRHRVFEFIPGTVAGETAKTVVFFSGLTVIPDAPEAYAQKEDIFEFIEHLPATFDESRALQGEIGEYVIMARRKGKQWFVGGLTNRESRDVILPCDFLDKETAYDVTLYTDTEVTHFTENREAYQVQEQTIRANESLEIKMAPGGGFALWIKPVNK